MNVHFRAFVAAAGGRDVGGRVSMILVLSPGNLGIVRTEYCDNGPRFAVMFDPASKLKIVNH